MKTLIVDYGRGNLQSVCRAIENCGGDYLLSSDPAEIAMADRLILPGVGAYGDCVTQLTDMGFVEPLREFVATQRPFLGICVGMQILLSSGEEFGNHRGLDLIPGKVRAIPKTDGKGAPHKIPHIGWTAIDIPEGQGAQRWQGTILQNTRPGAPVYFVHSFTAEPDDPGHRLADAHYNGRLIAAAVARDNITAVQFHPEKSGPVGLRIIDAFLKQ